MRDRTRIRTTAATPSDAEVVAGMYSPLALRRKAKGLSLADLAELTGLHRQKLSLVELGHIWPRPPVIRAIATGLGIEETEAFALIVSSWDWRRKVEAA
jgi:transcriptional regulator with XRE-family HTH domain